MAPPLGSAFAKVRWANKHLEELRDARGEFVNSGAYRVRTQFDDEEREWIDISEEGFRAFGRSFEPQYVQRLPGGRIRVSLLRGEIVNMYLVVIQAMPQLEWAVMVGNIAHNLRSALDVLVWDLSVGHQTATGSAGPPEPLPYRSPWRSVQFPIVSKETAWDNAKANNLRFIDPRLIPDFERLQPWYTGKASGRSPDAEWPTILQELSNRDKHRGVSFIGANASIVDIRLWDRERGAPLITFVADEIWAQSFGPVEDGTHLARYRLRPLVEIVGRLGVQVESRVTFDVAFAKGSPAEGEQVIATLERMSDRVAAILRQFRPVLV